MAEAPQHLAVDELREMIALHVDEVERALSAGIRPFTDQEKNRLIANALEAVRGFPLEGGPTVGIRLAPGLTKEQQQAVIRQLELSRDNTTDSHLIGARLAGEIRQVLGIVVN